MPATKANATTKTINFFMARRIAYGGGELLLGTPEYQIAGSLQVQAKSDLVFIESAETGRDASMGAS